MPTIYKNTVKVVPESMDYSAIEYAKPIKFSSSHFTQILYPIFGVFLFMALTSSMSSFERLGKAIKITLLVVLLLIGFIVFFHMCNLTGNQEILNMVFSFIIENYERSLFNDLHAIGSLIRSFTFVGEPGFTAVFYIMALGLIAGLKYSGYKGAIEFKHIHILIPVILVSLLILASTTGYLGVFTWIAAYLVLLKLRGGSVIDYETDKRIFMIGGSIIFLLGIIILIIVNYVGMDLIGFFLEHLSKLGGDYGSGMSRMQTIEYSFFEVFLEAPLLGVGFGSHRTSALFFTLLANIGIIGLFIFIVFNFFVARRAWMAMVKTDNPKLAQITFSILLSYLSIIPLLLFVKGLVSILFGWYWMLMAMMEACYRLYKSQFSDELDLFTIEKLK